MTKIANFVVISRDWKSPLKAQHLLDAINKVSATVTPTQTGTQAQVSDDICQSGDDSITTCVWPASIHRDTIREDVVDLFGWTDEIHIDESGELWFRFKDFGYGLKHGLSISRWLNEDDAIVWMLGLMAAEEFVDGHGVHEDDREDLEASIAAAKALI